ncbi:caspase family protein [Mesorhizobium sp. M0663]|uniref:caspase family protein n=1 Tax=Mesorhizobium sp. M0663 TaxID=2956981 RepID=UPI00333B0B69
MSGSGAIEGFARNLAFLVAIDDYAAGVPKLHSPVADAKALAQCLSDEHGFETELVLDGAATLAGLRTFFGDLPTRVGSDDRVLFYFAGHGTATPGSAGPTDYILPHDAERESNTNYLPTGAAGWWRNIRERLRRPCRSKPTSACRRVRCSPAHRFSRFRFTSKPVRGA